MDDTQAALALAHEEVRVREFELGLVQDLESELRAIERARDRLCEGRYGRCAKCGVPIGMLRLQAVPATERCAQHA